jgi:hypothetical protein
MAVVRARRSPLRPGSGISALTGLAQTAEIGDRPQFICSSDCAEVGLVRCEYSIVKNYNPPEAGTQWRARISDRSADRMRRRNLYRSMAALASG